MASSAGRAGRGRDGIVFTVWSGGSFDEAKVVLLSRRTGTYRTLVEGGSHGRVTSSGHLVFVRAGSLLAVPFDRDRREVMGSPVPILSGVMTNAATGGAQFDISEDGTLAYIPAGPTYAVSLAWSDRRHHVERIAVEPGNFLGPRLSPDGSRILASILTDLWTYDLNRDAFQRRTFRANNTMAIWSTWTTNSNCNHFPTTSCFVVYRMCWRSRDVLSGFSSHTFLKSMCVVSMRARARRRCFNIAKTYCICRSRKRIDVLRRLVSRAGTR